MKALIPFALVILLPSCGDGKKEAAEQMADTTAISAVAPVVLDLSTYDTPLLVELGDMSTLGVDSPTVKWNEEFGRLEVSAGEHFGLLITEEPADMARLKADLDRDMLQKHTVVEETPEKLVYRSQFPDDAGTFIHFYRTVQVGDRAFVITDAEQVRFNEADIARMAASIKTKAAV
ncbi:MAG: hypothetical protein JNM62_16270 [Flavobacteriales bacterium]|nr:hypothetical protein [Flavobacteriales bacterium]